MAGGTMLLVAAVVFLATLIRSAFGFGEALVAVPLLALLLPVETAAPLAVLFSITIAAVVVAQDWRKVHVGGAWRLVLSSFLGIPLGLLLLTAAPASAVKALLAIAIIAFSGFCLARRQGPELNDDRHAWMFGFVSGVMGGAYGMNGPPLVIYGALRRWSPEHFRATLQGYFLPASLAGMAGYWLAGLCVPALFHFYLLSLPAAVAAIFLGRAINQRMNGCPFVLYLHVGLIVIGGVLLIQSGWTTLRRP